MPRKTRLADQWESYAREVLPRNASTVHRWECRRAFYSGAVAIHGILMRSLSESPDATHDDISVMEDILSEFTSFAERVKAGTA